MNIPLVPTIVLPRMSAGELIAVVFRLKTSFRAAKASQVDASRDRAANATGRQRAKETPQGAAVPVAIPAAVTGCMKRLQTECAQLSQARRDAVTGTPSKPAATGERRGVAGRYRGAWNVLHRQFGVWRDAGTIAALDEATREAVARVFGASNERPILKGSARAMWTSGQETLDEMKSEGLDAVIASLGGTDVLARVRTVHDEVDVALRMTATPSGDAGVGIGDSMTAVQTVLREYVLKVHAMVAPEVPGSDALAAQLLAPFNDVVTAARPATKTTAVQKPATPVTPVAPVAPVAEPALKPTGTDR
ncbi:MAG: hypothetical protein U0326_18785 [Polyangiales bacterium]